MNTSPITAQSEKGTWATVEGVAQRQNKPCRMSFVERATFRAGNNKCVFFWEFLNLLCYQIDTKFSPMCPGLLMLNLLKLCWNYQVFRYDEIISKKFLQLPSLKLLKAFKGPNFMLFRWHNTFWNSILNRKKLHYQTSPDLDSPIILYCIRERSCILQ